VPTAEHLLPLYPTIAHYMIYNKGPYAPKHVNF
jgi:hypothetical protein